MKYLVKYSPEITIKSRPVRTRFAKQLKRNLQVLLHRLSERINVAGGWDFVTLEVPDDLDSLCVSIERVLASTQGICFFERVRHHTFTSLDEVLAHTLEVYRDRLEGKTFCVRCKRTGRHNFNSMDVERFVGGGLNQNTGAVGVSLNYPQVQVKVEIRGEELYVVDLSKPGINGFPLGTQDPVLSLISGGFDSAVSSYLAMRRGMLTHYCFFNLGGQEHEIAVKEVALYLWMRYGSTHPVKFVTVPFEGVVGEILEKVNNSHMGVVLKRMMLRAASLVAEQMQIEALVTGESVAQVSSQTLPNLAVIDKVTNCLVLRPLAMMEKQEIVDKARFIGIEEFSAVIPEYCGVISVKPTTRARMHKIERQESRFDFTILDKAVANTETVVIDLINLDVEKAREPVSQVTEPRPGDVIIDIRHPDEEEQQPLEIIGYPVERIPFYRINSRFPKLPQDGTYLLYCAKGVMSRLHTCYLQEQGFANVAVFRPDRR
jgi:thiamine biosynthesis protein ThiI